MDIERAYRRVDKSKPWSIGYSGAKPRKEDEMSKGIEGAKRGEMYRVPVESIVVPEDMRGRAFRPDIKNLIVSILTHGQIQPVGIRKSSDGKAVLVYGFSRVEAIRAINEDGGINGEPLLVKAALIDANADESFILNIQENFARNETSPIDDAHNIRILMDRLGKTQAEVAKIYDKSQAWVSLRLKLLALDTAIQKKVHNRDISADAALELGKLDKETQERVIAEPEEEEEETDDKPRRRGRPKSKKITKASIGRATGRAKGSAKELKELLSIFEERDPVCNILLRFINGEVDQKKAGREINKVLDGMAKPSK